MFGIHDNYNKLSAREKLFVDRMFASSVFKKAKEQLGYDLLANDAVEMAVEAVATWLVKSRENKN